MLRSERDPIFQHPPPPMTSEAKMTDFRTLNTNFLGSGALHYQSNFFTFYNNLQRPSTYLNDIAPITIASAKPSHTAQCHCQREYYRGYGPSSQHHEQSSAPHQEHSQTHGRKTARSVHTTTLSCKVPQLNLPINPKYRPNPPTKAFKTNSRPNKLHRHRKKRRGWYSVRAC